MRFSVVTTHHSGVRRSREEIEAVAPVVGDLIIVEDWRIVNDKLCCTTKRDSQRGRKKLGGPAYILMSGLSLVLSTDLLMISVDPSGIEVAIELNRQAVVKIAD